jgi:hypothetical protein
MYASMYEYVQTYVMMLKFGIKKHSWFGAVLPIDIVYMHL